MGYNSTWAFYINYLKINCLSYHRYDIILFCGFSNFFNHPAWRLARNRWCSEVATLWVVLPLHAWSWTCTGGLAVCPDLPYFYLFLVGRAMNHQTLGAAHLQKKAVVAGSPIFLKTLVLNQGTKPFGNWKDAAARTRWNPILIILEKYSTYIKNRAHRFIIHIAISKCSLKIWLGWGHSFCKESFCWF